MAAKKAKNKEKGEEGDQKKRKKVSRKTYEQELEKLQVELCRIQEWVKHKGLKVVVIFEGRDAAGKGGVIKRITERVSPRVFRTVALPSPSDREKTQFYIQRYIAHLPAAGEIVLFDRSWYNRAGVERVMNFCTDEEYEAFMRIVPGFERELMHSGIILIKYFFDVSRDIQEKRFIRRMDDPMRQWKLSPMDAQSWARWWDYTKAFDRMMLETDTPIAPWYVVKADDKRRARLNCISHLISKIPYEVLPYTPPKVPRRRKRQAGTPDAPSFQHFIPEKY